MDTDEDGISDDVDAFPNDATEWLDTDGDGVGNNQDADDDGDGMPDSWEALYGLNPLVDDAQADLDGDGLTNLAEYQGGSDPATSDEDAEEPPAIDVDTDEDGISDDVDAFPNDATEWLDTDGDGVGNNQDADDDGDGMPDSWEALYDGLDPLVDDAQEDLDGDGQTNLAEYQNGTDPSSVPENTVPDAPVLVSPLNGAAVTLAPILVTGHYYDADADPHYRTRYQVAIANTFSQATLVYDHTTDSQLTYTTIVDLVLDPETVYYWRVRFFDSHNGASDWSETYSFTTQSYYAAGDSDANGVLDNQQIYTHADVDGNGIADVSQEGILSVITPDPVNPQMAVLCDSDRAQIAAIKAYQVGGLGLADNAPENMTGLVSFKLYLNEGVTATNVTIYFTQTAPSDARWYKYDAEEGWSAYDNAVFSSNRKSVTIAIEDGGIGDQDGVRNGVIVDPAGLGYSSTDAGSNSVNIGMGAGGGGCFIGLPLKEVSANTGATSLLVAMASNLCLLVLAVFFMGVHKKRH